jgi:hypothetical protein
VVLPCSCLYEAHLHLPPHIICFSFESLLQPLMNNLASAPRRLLNRSRIILFFFGDTGVCAC